MAFHIKIQGGLCNRLRVIASGMKLAKDTSQAVEFLWPWGGGR